MTLFGTVVGFSLFGLGSRFGQLAIQKRNLMDNVGGHVIAMLAFGYAGYWAHKWDERAGVILTEKRAEIAEKRAKHLAQAES